jgi:hypothetical protein
MSNVKPEGINNGTEPDIELLHTQSVEWISDIAFWRDEAAFLYSLEVKKVLKELSSEEKNKLEKIETDLIKIAGHELDTLYDAVTKHEHSLSSLLESNNCSDHSYIDGHKQVAQQVNFFDLRFKILKKHFFDIVKQAKGNLLEGILGIKGK